MNWIPVNSKMPENDGYYIVTEKVYDYDDKTHNGDYKTIVETVYFCNGATGRTHNYVVVAWMDLPKAYSD